MPQPRARFSIFNFQFSIRAALILFVLCASSASSASAAQRVHARVVGVSDGDTVTVVDAAHLQLRVRLQGIDAPEKSQPYGKVSKYNLSQLIYGRDVDLEIVKQDRYGRSVAKILLGGHDICLEQLRDGMAWFYADYERELSPADRALYAAAERDARLRRKGLWADPAPMPPWQFRRGTRGVTRETRRPSPPSTPPPAGAIVGNRRSLIYHRPDCPGYAKVSPRNRVVFATEAVAAAAGYRIARDCP